MSKGPREMTPADRRRVTTIDDGIHDAGVIVIEPKPPADKFGRLLPVISEDEHRGLMHNDGNAEPRPPAAWERANSASKAHDWPKERETLNRAIRSARSSMPDHERLRVLAQEIGALASMGARPIRETDAKSADSKDQAPRGGEHEGLAYADADEVRRRFQIVHLEIEALEELLDIHRGLVERSYVLMSTERKNAIITGPGLRNLTPEEVTALHPELGSARTIRRVRSEAGQRGDGNPKPVRAA